MGFSRQEYWSGLPFPSPGDLPNPGIEARSPAVADGFSTAEPPGKPTAVITAHPAVLLWPPPLLLSMSLLLLLVLLVLQRMSPTSARSSTPYFSAMTTQWYLMQPPGLAFLDPQQEALLGLDNFEINTLPCPSQGTAVSQWSVPSQRWHSAHIPIPTLWHNDQPTFVIKDSIFQDHPVSCELTDSLVSPDVWGKLQLPSCPLPTVPFSTTQPLNKSLPVTLPTKHCPPVNLLTHPPHPQHNGLMTTHHLLHLKHPSLSNSIFHPSCCHTLTGHPCP